MVDDIHARVIAIEPHLTLILDMDPEVALTRGLARCSGEDRFEEFGLRASSKSARGAFAPGPSACPLRADTTAHKSRRDCTAIADTVTQRLR